MIFVVCVDGVTADAMRLQLRRFGHGFCIIVDEQNRGITGNVLCFAERTVIIEQQRSLCNDQ